MQDFDFERYKGLDVSGTKPARLNPKIKQLQDNLGVKAPKMCLSANLIAMFKKPSNSTTHPKTDSD